MQSVDPSLVVYLPYPHSEQTKETPTAMLYLPTGQSSQAVPALFDTLPAAQLKQELDTGQKLLLAEAPAADTNVVPTESFTFQVFSAGMVPAVACPK